MGFDPAESHPPKRESGPVERSTIHGASSRLLVVRHFAGSGANLSSNSFLELVNQGKKSLIGFTFS